MKPSIITYIFIILLSASCTGRHTRLLDRAEQLTFTDPDSACALLDSMPAPASGELRARHALLTTGAQYYAARCPETDSIIRIAVDYYDTRTDSPRRMLSYYYQGLVLIKARDYGNAVVSLLNAEHTARILNDHKYLGLIYRAIADSFDALKDYKSALRYFEQSYEELSMSGDEKYIGYSLFDIARSSLNSFDAKRCIEICDTLLVYAQNKNDEYLAADIMLILASAYFEKGQYAKSIDTWNRMFDFMPEYRQDIRIWRLGAAYTALNKIDEAVRINDTLHKYNPGEQWLTYHIKIKRGEYEEALPLLGKELDNQNAEYKNFILRDFSHIIDKYYHLQNTALENSIDELRYRNYLIAAVAVFIIIIGIILYRNRVRRLRDTINQKIFIAGNLKEILQQRDAQIHDFSSYVAALEKDRINTIGKEEYTKLLSEKKETEKKSKEIIQKLLSSHFATLERLCASFNLYEGKTNKQQKIYEKVNQYINQLKYDADFRQSIDKLVNDSMNNVVDRLKTDLPKLKDYEIQLFTFIILGFSSQAISFLQNIPVNTVYSRKNNLKQKISKSGLPSADEYIALMV